MRITAMIQIAKGLQDDAFKEKMLKELERVKWRLWHGHVSNALLDLELMLEECELGEHEADPRRDQLLKALLEYHTYIFNNQTFIPNYAERYRYDEIISTSFAESAINEVVSKRMVKKQQMRWTKKGAHLLLQVRVKTLNGELQGKFAEWYPGLQRDSESATALPLAA
jgi:hypothetical protein